MHTCMRMILDWQSSPVRFERSQLVYRDFFLFCFTFSFLSFMMLFSLSLSSLYFVSFIFQFSNACNSLFQSEFWLYSILDAYKKCQGRMLYLNFKMLLCFELSEYKLRIHQKLLNFLSTSTQLFLVDFNTLY